MSICRDGLFVGVQDYANLGSDDQLPGACLGAQQLHAQFQRAALEGRWVLLTRHDNIRVTRSEILIRFKQYIRDPGAASVVLFYFAGHGTIDRGQMILAGEDYVPAAPFDTGVPLSRLIDLVREYGSLQCKYLFIIDACRSGRELANSLMLPENISICYSCAAGQRSAEIGHQGEFLRALLYAFRSVGRLKVDGCHVVTWQEIMSVLTAGSMSSAINAGVAVDIHNAPARTIYLPACDDVEADEVGKQMFPDVYLETSRFGTSFLLRCQREAKEALEGWVGYPVPDTSFSIRDDVTGWAQPGAGCVLSVKLPEVTIRSNRAGEIRYVLTRCPNAFSRLRFTWSRAIPIQWADRFAMSFQLRKCVIPSNGRIALLEWDIDGARGQIYADHDAEITSISISGYTLANNPWPLMRLGSKLFDVYASLCTLHAYTPGRMQ